MIQNNLNTVLKRAAQAWYVAELNNLKCRALHDDCGNKTELWMDTLMKKFKKQPEVAFSKLTNEKYTIKNAQSHWELAMYVQAIVYHAKGASINQVYNQLIFAHEHIEPKFRFMVDLLTKATLVAQYIQTLEIKKLA